MPHIELTGDDRYLITNELGFLARLLGLPLVGFGAWVGLWPVLANLVDWLSDRLTTVQFVELIPGMLIGMIVGLPLLGVGWALAFFQSRLEIDLVERKITSIKDFRIRSFRKSYSLDDIDRVAVEFSTNRTQSKTDYYANVIIATKAEQLTVATWPARQEDEARKLARELSELTGITLVDKTGNHK